MNNNTDAIGQKERKIMDSKDIIIDLNETKTLIDINVFI
jgi:hypothetical protein